MRILHVTDIHCSNQDLLQVLNKENYDVIMATGDFQCVDTAEILLDKAQGKILAVTGNMDDPSIARRLREAGVLLDGRIAAIGRLSIVGIGGLDVASSLQRLRSLIGSGTRVDVLLSHHPPRGILDRVFLGLRIGLREIREFVETVKPKLHVFGHVHEARGVQRLGGTVFVNAGPLKKGYYALVVLEEDVGVELKRI